MPKRKPRLSPENQRCRLTYNQYLDHVVGQGNFWMVRKYFINIMSVRAAFLLTYLLDLRELVVSVGGDDGEWFYCTHHKLEQDLRLGRTAQDSILRELREKGIIQIENQGIPRRRWIRICPEGLESQYLESEKHRKMFMMQDAAQQISGVKTTLR